MKDDTRTSLPDGMIEVMIAVVLSAGGLTTSWASYQAALWDGEQAAHYSRANALRVMASRERLEADARRAIEMQLFNNWLQAQAKGDEKLAEFYRARFPADLAPAFEAWLAEKPLKNPDAPPSPFAIAAYRPAGLDTAARLDAQADATFETGQDDNRISDIFTQGALIMATSMFFGGIGQVFRLPLVRVLLLAVAMASCVMGLVRILNLPILTPG